MGVIQCPTHGLNSLCLCSPDLSETINKMDKAEFDRLGCVEIGVDLMDDGSEIVHGYFSRHAAALLRLSDGQVMPDDWFDNVNPDLQPACWECFQELRDSLSAPQ